MSDEKKPDEKTLLTKGALLLGSLITHHIGDGIRTGDIRKLDKAKDELIPLYEITALIAREKGKTDGE